MKGEGRIPPAAFREELQPLSQLGLKAFSRRSRSLCLNDNVRAGRDGAMR